MWVVRGAFAGVATIRLMYLELLCGTDLQSLHARRLARPLFWRQ